MKITKTNAARILEKSGISFQLIPYGVDESDLSAVHVAETLGEPIERVFKTILLEGDKTGPIVCVIPGDKEVDLKAAAKVSGNKKIEPVPLKNLLSISGYIRGGCSPVGMKKLFPTYIHSSAENLDLIFVSAGARGLQIQIAPVDLQKAVRATFAAIAKTF